MASARRRRRWTTRCGRRNKLREKEDLPQMRIKALQHAAQKLQIIGGSGNRRVSLDLAEEGCARNVDIPAYTRAGNAKFCGWVWYHEECGELWHGTNSRRCVRMAIGQCSSFSLALISLGDRQFADRTRAGGPSSVLLGAKRPDGAPGGRYGTSMEKQV